MPLRWVSGRDTACARGLGAACARCLGVAWARGLGSASARSTRSWHCAHDHPPMCAGIECPMPQISFCSLHCPQCLGHPNPHPNPTSNPTSESRNALFLLGSSHGCKVTHEALPHVDPRLRLRRGLQTQPRQLRSTSSSTQTTYCHRLLDLVPNPRTAKASKARCLCSPTNPHRVLLKSIISSHLRFSWPDFPQATQCTASLFP